MNEPKEIYMFQKEIIIRKTPMVKNSEDAWIVDESYEEITYGGVVKEWFEDENGVELEMEEI